MADNEQYHNNTIQVRKRADGSEELLINNKLIDVSPDRSMPGMLRSEYSFLPAPTLLELGRLVVDAQRALVNPKLDTLKPEEDE
jgi:hypothetical protein